MHVHPPELHGRFWRWIASGAYQASLFLYPKSFRCRFGSEMAAVFEEALDEKAQNGFLAILFFLGRELIEAPISILKQHCVINTIRARTCFNLILAFTLGFGLLGLIDLFHETNSSVGILGYLVNLFNNIIAGGLGGLAIGVILAPHMKAFFALCGMVGCLLLFIFPNPVASCIFYFVLGLVFWNWRGLLRLAGFGSLALLVALFMNRLSAALVQSYIFHSPSQTFAQTGISMILIPYLVEGIFLGIFFGGMAPESLAVKA
jgi:hypothetical protein